jgi:hypothetical protein
VADVRCKSLSYHSSGRAEEKSHASRNDNLVSPSRLQIRRSKGLQQARASHISSKVPGNKKGTCQFGNFSHACVNRLVHISRDICSSSVNGHYHFNYINLITAKSGENAAFSLCSSQKILQVICIISFLQLY